MRSRERRSAVRVPYHGCVWLVIPGGARIAGCICNLSASGVCLETSAHVEAGTFVCLDGGGLLAQGVVCFCRRRGVRYRIGVAIDPLEAA